MRIFRIPVALIAVIFVFAAASLYAEQAEYPATEEDLIAEIENL